MCHALFTIFILGSYITNMATSSIYIQHSTFYSIRFKDQEKPTQPLAKTAVECARLCFGNLPQCYGFEVEHSTSKCQAYATPTLNASDISLPGLGQEKAFYDRVLQCPYWNGFMEVHVNNADFCIAINTSINVTYSIASTLCQAKGGYLLRLDSLDKYDAIHSAKDAFGVDLLRHWIGASDQLTEGHWVHEVDGQPIAQSLFVWQDSQVIGGTNTDENCAVVHGKDRNSMRINDRGCETRRGFICEALPQ